MQKVVSVNEAWDRKYPEQVVLVITRNDDGRINLMAVGWVAVVSDEPPMFMLGIDHPAYTLELIRKHREFVVAYPSKEMADAVLYAGTVHGHNEDKGSKSGLKFSPGIKGNVPLLTDAVANFECRLTTEYCPGNCPLIIGEIINATSNENPEVKRLINAGKGYDLQ